MVKDKVVKNKGTDKVLTVIFIIAILSGFYLVSMVNASFEADKENVTLFKSGSTINFIDVEITDTPYSTWEIMDTAYYLTIPGVPTFENYSKTPVFLGNDTWSMSINGSAHASSQYAQYVIELPELDNWIITDITINQTKNTDSDLRVSWAIYSIPIANTIKFADLIPSSTLVYTDLSAGSSSIYYNKTQSVNLATSLDIHDKSIDGVKHFIVVQMFDSNIDGLGSYYWDFEMEIEGKQIDSYNIMQQLDLALGIAIVINIVVIIYMTDEIDIGGFVNDIPDKKRRS